MEPFKKNSLLGFWPSLYLVYKKDIKTEYRSPQGLLFLFLFATVLAAIYSYSLRADVFKEVANFDGVLLATLFFSATLYQSPSMQAESEAGAQRILNMSRIDFMGVYFAKVLIQFQNQLLFIIYCVPMYYLFLKGGHDYGEVHLYFLFITMIFCSLGLSALYTLFQRATYSASLKNNFLPILLLPTALPLLLFGLRFLELTRNLASFRKLNFEYYILLIIPSVLCLSIGSLLYFYVSKD